MTNIIIIGKEGYIGGALTRHFLSQKSYNIVAPALTECNFLNLLEVKNFFANISYQNCHVVFAAVINKSENDSLHTFLQNVKIVSNFIEGQKVSNLSSIIFLSSVDVYGRNSVTPITEETKINPDNWYGLSKYVSEWMLASSEENKCPVTILRLPGIYGKSPNDKSVITIQL